jgi:hypothetical protein
MPHPATMIPPTEVAIAPSATFHANNTTSTIQMPRSSPIIDEDACVAALITQLDYYFSLSNLQTDAYLVSQMNPQKYVPIDVICQFNKVRYLTTDRRLILTAMRHCSNLVLDSTETMVKPAHLKAERTTLILRDVHPSVTVDDIQALFTNSDAPAQPTFIRPEVDATWFLTFPSEDACVETCFWLTTQTLKDQQVHCRVKSETVLRGFYAQPPQQQQRAVVRTITAPIPIKPTATPSTTVPTPRKKKNRALDANSNIKSDNKTAFTTPSAQITPSAIIPSAAPVVVAIGAAPTTAVAPPSVSSVSDSTSSLTPSSQSTASLQIPSPINYASRVGAMDPAAAAKVAAAVKAQRESKERARRGETKEAEPIADKKEEKDTTIIKEKESNVDKEKSKEKNRSDKRDWRSNRNNWRREDANGVSSNNSSPRDRKSFRRVDISSGRELSHPVNSSPASSATTASPSRSSSASSSYSSPSSPVTSTCAVSHSPAAARPFSYADMIKRTVYSS